jgi:hypothetical protein
MKRVTYAAALAVLCATPVFAQEKAASAPATLPAGWQMRLDKETADASKLSFATMAGGFHATSGPAAIFWKPENNMKGDFKISATFTQTKAPMHPEAYGLFVGGKNLNTDKQEYGYVIVRGDGKYSIKHRAGTEVHTVQDWTDFPALKKQDASGKATNTVAFDVSGGAVKALINGQEVKRWEKGYWTAEGFAGLRINHNLDVHVSDFSITPAK